MQRFLSKFIDSRNSSIWDNVSHNYRIELKQSMNGEYSIYTQNKKATIFVLNDFCIDSFTHELLHLYLEVKGVLVGQCLNLSRHSDSKLLQILSDPLVEHISNCLDHIKMLPIYLELGFRREKFLHDYDIHKCKEGDINTIKFLFKSGASYRALAVNDFIGKYIAIKADPNISFDYSSALSSLKDIDYRLFTVLENFHNDWSKIDVEQYDLFHNYRDVVFGFYNELNIWASDKQFI